ncbi:lipopolysaccharide biosynthesis protein [Mesorhizobium sp. BAC0120]|uniref:lipopolysaccharide biosynthesis protein n=1 Tax=Mesorhizobium sp. BAC0120 TaxID=3090670 RepID=UPI00298CF117|nr:lipopolysaccharide biosynthesis protein [Mesorhizobium sp. BAC0120]MDW6026300.1 lipopolysaccharide biosynthesis protein [Mesorhizobium sp. BAC0120]
MKSRLAKSTFWITVTRAATNLLGLASTIVLARLLMPADFGLVAVATTILAIVSSVTELSLSNALIQHSNPTDEHFHTAWSLNMVRAVIISALLMAAAYPTALIYRDPRLIGIMIALGLTVILSGALNPKLVVFERSLDFRPILYRNVGSKAAGFVAAVGVAIVYRSYWALVVGSIVAQLATLLLSYTLKPFRPRVMWRHAGELWSFSIWLTLSQIVRTLNWRFDQLLVGWILGKASLGYYTVGNNLAYLPTTEATSPLTQTLFPAFSALKHDRARLRKAYSSAQALTSAIALPVAFGWALIADPTVRLIMGEKWLPAVIVVQIIACVAGIATLANSVQPLALAMGEPRKIFHRDTAFFLIRMPLIVIGMYEAGLLGMLWVRVVTASINTLVNMQLVSRLIGIPVWTQLLQNLRTIVATTTMVIVVLLVRPRVSSGTDMMGLLVEIAVLASVGALTYVVVTLLLWKAENYPDGPENEVLRAVQKLRSFAFARS